MARDSLNKQETVDELRMIRYDLVENIQTLATTLLKQSAVLEMRLRKLEHGIVDYMEEHGPITVNKDYMEEHGTIKPNTATQGKE